LSIASFGATTSSCPLRMSIIAPGVVLLVGASARVPTFSDSTSTVSVLSWISATISAGIPIVRTSYAVLESTSPSTAVALASSAELYPVTIIAFCGNSVISLPSFRSVRICLARSGSICLIR
jgi:hypothetical protein